MTELRTLLRLTLITTVIAVVGRGDPYYGAFCLFALGAVTVAGYGRLPIELEVAVLGLMFLDMTVGNALGVYRAVPWFDKALHVAVAMLLGGMLFTVLASLRMARWIAAVAAVLLTLGVGTAWELAEYGVDHTLARQTQTSPTMTAHDDTMFDLALDAVGGMLGVLLGLRRRTMQA
ncbi:MAG: hypothetical protein SFX73_02065 [Kofleriaceae bacterium]|nr:hypothetical protein [Kofleriaceae bacterium]